MGFSLPSFLRRPADAPGRYASRALQRVILTSWAAATLVAAIVAVAGFRIDNSLSVWFEAADPALADYRKVLGDFGHREWMLVALHGVAANPASRAADRQKLVGRLAQLPDVHSVLSI